MKKTLNDKFLENVKSGGKAQIDVFDAATAGLAIRVTENGKKSWSFTFSVPTTRKRARVTLGSYPATGLAEARTRAIKAQGQVEAGLDPRYVAQDDPADITIAELVDQRVAMELRADAENYLRSCLEIERCYDVDVIPVVGHFKVKAFTIAHLNLIIDPIKARGAPIQANRVFEHTRALLKFAVRRGVIPYNPLAEARAPSQENVKVRFLKAAEIRQLWWNADQAIPGSKQAPNILRLILATMQRPGEEVAGMERHEVDLAKKLWIIPAHKAKNEDEHHVPLNDLAVAIIAEQMRRTNGTFLFPHDEDRPVPCDALDKFLTGALEPRDGMPLGRLGIAKFTPHDLRRTGSTQCSLRCEDWNMPEDYISHLMNHRSVTKNSITKRVYIVNQHMVEKRFVAERWGQLLAEMIGEEALQQEAA